MHCVNNQLPADYSPNLSTQIISIRQQFSRIALSLILVTTLFNHSSVKANEQQHNIAQHNHHSVDKHIQDKQRNLIGNLPPIAATFTSETEWRPNYGEAHKTSKQWHLWRTAEHIQTQDKGANESLAWRFLGNQVVLQRHFHPEAFTITYSRQDITLLGLDQQWQQQAHVVNPELLQQLKIIRTDNKNDQQKTYYKGVIGDTTITLVWIDNWQLPALYEAKSPQKTERLTLNTANSPAVSEWQPESTLEYQDMDYVDIGDNEAHPIASRAIQGIGADDSTIQYVDHQH